MVMVVVMLVKEVDKQQQSSYDCKLDWKGLDDTSSAQYYPSSAIHNMWVPCRHRCFRCIILHFRIWFAVCHTSIIGSIYRIKPINLSALYLPCEVAKKKLDKTLIWLCWTPLLLLFQKTSSALCHAPLPLAPLFSQALIQALAAKRFGPNFSCKRCHSHPKLCWHHVTQANVSTPAVCLCLMPKV